MTPPGLVVTPSAAILQVGELMQAQASAERVTWASSNPAIASVDARGLVTGRSAGQAAITARKRNQRGAMQLTIRNRLDPSNNAIYGPQRDVTQPVGSVAVAPGASTIHAAVSANPINTTFWLQAGTYSITSSITPKSGQTFVGEYGATIDGATWSTSDRDDAAFRSVNNGVTGVTIRNLVIAYCPEYGVNAYLTASGWTIDHCEIHHGRNGVSVGIDGVVTNNFIHHNIGIFNDPDTALRGGGIVLNSAQGTRIVHNEVSYNGQEQKFIYGTLNEPNQDLYVADNFYHHNVLDGIWIDGDGAGSIIENNVCEDNGRTGITVEIGSNVIVRNNVCRRQTAGEAILISASRDCTVSGNTLEANIYGIGLFLDFARLAESYPFWTVDLSGNTISGNTVRVPVGAGTNFAALLTFTGSGTQTPYLDNTKNNHFSANTYYAQNTTGNWFVWNGNKSFTQWQALPQDATGSIAVG